jgi:hypothetical protein
MHELNSHIYFLPISTLLSYGMLKLSLAEGVASPLGSLCSEDLSSSIMGGSWASSRRFYSVFISSGLTLRWSWWLLLQGRQWWWWRRTGSRFHTLCGVLYVNYKGSNVIFFLFQVCWVTLTHRYEWSLEGPMVPHPIQKKYYKLSNLGLLVSVHVQRTTNTVDHQ